jgi:hypothetical protein
MDLLSREERKERVAQLKFDDDYDVDVVVVVVVVFVVVQMNLLKILSIEVISLHLSSLLTFFCYCCVFS